MYKKKMTELRNRILSVIEEIEKNGKKSYFMLSDISKVIVDVKEKKISNELRDLVEDDIVEIVIYEPLCMALKNQVVCFKHSIN